MAKNFLDKTGLAHFWSKISSKIAEVKTLANNSIKSLSVSGKVITYTKNDGSTGTITTQDTNTVTTATTTGSGNAVTSVTANNGALTVTKGTTFLTAHPTISKSTDTTSSSTASHGGTITMVDSVTRDTNGHVTKVNTKTVTLPNNNNTDTKVTNTLAPTTKAYVTGTTSATTNTGTQVFDTGVYLDTTAGKLTATTFNGALTGNADTATSIKCRQLSSTKAETSGYVHIYTFEVSVAYAGATMLIGVTDVESGCGGLLYIKCRNGSTSVIINNVSAEWIGRTPVIPDAIVTRQINESSVTYRVYLSVLAYRKYSLSILSNYFSSGVTVTEENTIVTELEGTEAYRSIGGYAARLATARNLKTDLASTTAGSFDGTADVDIGVTGTLPVANGGTGAVTIADACANLGVKHCWEAIVTCSTWSRLCYIDYCKSYIGSKYILSIGTTRTSVVYNDTYLVTAHHNSNGKIIKLAGSNYSDGYQVRLLADLRGNSYFELYDNCNNTTSSTTQKVYCELIPISTGEITKYNTFTDGTTVPEDFKIVQTMTVDKTDIQANLSGNATTATTATKLGSSTVGGVAKPIYLNAGTPTACSSTVGSATKPVYMNAGTITACTYTLGKSVPSDAVFTDTVYTLPTASSSTLGGVKTTSTVTSTIDYTACPIIGGVPYYKNTNKVTQTMLGGTTATDAEHSLLFTPADQTATTTTTTEFVNWLKFNPSTNTLTNTQGSFYIASTSGATVVSGYSVVLNPTKANTQITGTATVSGKLTAANIITGTVSKTLSSATTITYASINSSVLGFTPTENTSVVASLRELGTPSTIYLNLNVRYYTSAIYFVITNGANSSTTVPAGTYYIDYIVTNNA